MRTVERTRGAVGVAVRRALLAAGAGDLDGCLRSPSSGGPPYRTHEVDDGPVYAPGRRADRPTEFSAASMRPGPATDGRHAGRGRGRAVARDERS